jgi:plastocyanin
MKHFFTIIFAIFLFSVRYSDAGTITIKNSGFSFTPANVTIQQGDTVVFSISSSHNAVEVSQLTWNANGNASNGGFNIGFGGGQQVFNTAGEFYYVCTPHASGGMKGKITVSGVTAINDKMTGAEKQSGFVSVYPNPFSTRLTLAFSLAEPHTVAVELLDITGKSMGLLINGYYNTGRHVQSIDLAYLKPGLYLIRYDSPEGSEVHSLLKASR